MAEKKSTSILGTLYLFFWAILPCVYLSEGVIDKTLAPRQMFVAIFLLGLMLVGWKRIVKHKLSLEGSELAYSTFFIVSGIATITAFNQSESIAILSKYALVLVFLIITATLLKRKEVGKEVMVKGVVIFGLVSTAIASFQISTSFSNGDLLKDIYVIKGSFSHKNLLSSALMLSLPFVIMGRTILKGSWKKISSVLLIVMVLEIFVLRTRGVWLSVFVGGAVCLLAYKLVNKENRHGLIIPVRLTAILSGIAILLVVLAFLNNSGKNKIDDQTSFQHRLVFWENSVEMIKENPVLGVGPGNWRIFFPKYGLGDIDHSVMQGVTHIQRPHNDYLWVTSEGGIVAGLCYMAVFILAIVRVFKNLKSVNSKEDLVISLCVLMGIAAYMMFSMTDFPMERISHSLLAMTFLSFAFLNGKGFSLTLSYKPVQILLIAFTLGGLYVSYNRLQGEKGAVKVLQYNKSRNAQRIIPAVDDAENSLYTLDNFSNPLRYYSSIGHLVLGQAQEAKEDLLIAEEHHPNNILVLNQMGNVLKTQNQTEEALAYYERAVEIAPLFEQALLNKAEIFIQRKDAVGAMSALERILPNSKNPKYREYMESVLPVLVAEREKHGKYKKLVAAIISKSPQTRQQYWQAYSSFKDQKRSNRNAKKVNKP